MPSPRPKSIAIAAALTILGCATVRPDIAILDTGGVHVDSIDRLKFPQPYSTFELKPGAHTIDVTFTWAELHGPLGGGVIRVALAPHHTEKRSLCVKARGGKRYRIKTVIQNNQMYAFIIDASTGEPPKTPCGPDEDDD